MAEKKQNWKYIVIAIGLAVTAYQYHSHRQYLQDRRDHQIPMVAKQVTASDEALKAIAESRKPKPTPAPTPLPKIAAASQSASVVPPGVPTPVPQMIFLPRPPTPPTPAPETPTVTIRKITPTVKTSIYLNIEGRSLRFELARRFDSMTLPNRPLEFSPAVSTACRSCLKVDGKLSDIKDDSFNDWQLTAKDANCEVGFEKQSLTITQRPKLNDCVVGRLTEFRGSNRTPAAVLKKKVKVYFTRGAS